MNHSERLVSAKAFIRSPELLAGFHSAWRGDPPTYDAISNRSHGTRYEIGRQLAVWMKSGGITHQKRPAPTITSLKGMARETGFPVIIGVNR